jgi:hypothetical protein
VKISKLFQFSRDGRILGGGLGGVIFGGGGGGGKPSKSKSDD